MKEQRITSRIWRFVWPSLVIAGVAALLAGATFVFWTRMGTFSIRAYSDRVFWAGIALIVLGGFAVVASLGSMKTIGTPSVLTAGADARNAQSRIQDHFNVNSKRARFVLRMFLSGSLCIALSALTEILSRPQ